MPSKTFTLLFLPRLFFAILFYSPLFSDFFSHFFYNSFFHDFSACKCKHHSPQAQRRTDMENMASKEKLLKVIETTFLIIFALLPQSKAVLPRYITVLQPGYVERDDLIESYFQLGLRQLKRIWLTEDYVEGITPVKSMLFFRLLRPS